MNILFYESGINPLGGGVGRVSFNIAKILRQEGHNVYVAYQSNEVLEGKYHVAFIDGIIVNRLNKESQRKLCQFIKGKEIGIVINQGGSVEMCSFFSKLRKPCNLRLYTFIHISPTGSHDVLGYRDYRFPKLVLRSLIKECLYRFYDFEKHKYRKLYHLSDKVVLLSNSFVEDFKKNIGANDDNHKIVAIANTTTYPIQDEQSILREKEKIILVVARMGETPKKLSQVLDSWNAINGQLTDWQLIFVGDGSELKAYKKLSERLRLPRLTFTGTANPYPYYKKASIFLMTSATEGFGMTLLESQQCGVVPIAMDSYKAVRDIIDDGVNGFITPNKDVNEFSEKIVWLAKNDDKRKNMAINAMRSSQRFSEDKIYSLWKKLLEDATESDL